ncbi:FtsX domain-containing protein [Naegleria gruberi]|uniref:FtsX domain-containing protein n=1 Tax=Naegleria gruberi TaxID=5762 RepID=D2V8A1_NAEGR|nr:FtsX domain-containing protein [Naegleria gruberi]EFC47009.1 FtsX domain-containing protein [Naegleria gruberi]|eukprot:XP_002679753.1 FtsX domain-containing protein [Naegleria gruberi strain NEG-M]
MLTENNNYQSSAAVSSSSSSSKRHQHHDDDDNDYDDKFKKFSDPTEAAKHTFRSLDRVPGSSFTIRSNNNNTTSDNNNNENNPIDSGFGQNQRKFPEKPSAHRTPLQQVGDFFNSLIFSLLYVTADTKKRFYSFLVGLITIAIVVFVVSILYNSILKANLIFLKLSEDNVGDADIMFTPKFTNLTTIPFINNTEISEKLANSPYITGTTPRWIIFANLQNRDQPQKNISGLLLILDTEREEQLGIGRIWPYRPLGEGEIHVRDSILRAIDVKPNRGQRTNLVIDFASLASAFSGMKGESSVVDSITSNYAKYPSALGNVMIIDSHYVGQIIEESLFASPSTQLLLEITGNTQKIKNFFKTFPIEQYSLTLAGRLKDRFPTYLKSDNERKQAVIGITNGMMDSIGVAYPVTYTLPLLSALDGTKFISLFIDQIFIGVVVMLAILGIILIFALLLANVEEKTYEYGMLRALGLRQYSLIQVILAQSMYFAIPAIIIAMVLAFLVNILVEYVLQVVISTPSLNLYFFWAAVVVPIALGFGIPIIANVIPIRHAMSRTLRDSLDIAHQTFNETTVKMIKLEELGLEPWQTGVSILLVIIGFVVYYMIPYSFIFTDLPLFFFILNAILLGMLVGLCIIAVVLEPFFEKIILNLILCGPERKLKTLISKNLAGHRKRSRKTFLMFTLSVAFIVFAGVVFSLQSANIRANVEAFLGADIVVISTNSRYSLPKDKLNEAIALQNSRNKTIEAPVKGHAYQSFSIANIPFFTGSRFSSLAYFPNRRVVYNAVDRNFLSVVKSKYFLYTYIDSSFTYNITDEKPDVFQSLYDNAGQALVDGEKVGFAPSIVYSGVKLNFEDNYTLTFDPASQYSQYIDIVASEAMRPSVGIGIKTPTDLRFSGINSKTGTQNYVDFIGKSRCLAYKVPGFFYSSYELTASGSPVIITMDAYKKIARSVAKSVGLTTYNDEVYYQKLFIKLKDEITTFEVQDVFNALQASVSSDFTSIQNVRDLVGSTETATLVLMAFFNIVAAIAIILCFFMLAVSFTANVRDNSWEFGVLRSIGLSVNALIRAYIYEALCLVISAFISGTVIGCVIALTLTAQFNLFLEMPFQFDFPYYLFFSILIMALICAILGSYLPARNLRKKEIALVIRGAE